MDNQQAPPIQPVAKEGKALSFWQKFTYSLGNVGVNLAPGVVVGWMILFYMERPHPNGIAGEKLVLVTAGFLAAMNMVGRIVDSLADPLVGYYSDKWKTRWGRRMPWIVIGSPLLALFTAMVWFPPDDHATLANAIWLGISLSGLWFFYTVVVAPYLALLPEITPYSNERVNVSAMMAYMVVVGMVMGTLGAGMIFDTFKDGVDIGPIHFSDGYKFGGVLFGVLTMLFFLVSVLLVREKPADEIKPVKFRFLEAAKECSKNPGFWPYIASVSLLRLGIDVLIAMIPIMVVTLIGYGEDVAGIMQAVIILGAALLFPLVSALANKHGKKKIMSIGLIGFVPTLVLMGLLWHWPFVGYIAAGAAGLFGVEMSQSAIMLAHCIGLFVVGMFPVGVVLVLPYPIYADVMDHDEVRTGYRREAMYNGMEGLITKFAAGLAGAIVPLLLANFGNTKEDPWGILAAGPIAGVFFLLGFFTFKKHPFD